MPAVNPEILIWARKTAGLTLQDAVAKVGIRDARGVAAIDRLTALERGGAKPPGEVRGMKYWRIGMVFESGLASCLYRSFADLDGVMGMVRQRLERSEERSESPAVAVVICELPPRVMGQSTPPTMKPRRRLRERVAGASVWLLEPTGEGRAAGAVSTAGTRSNHPPR